MAGKSDIEGRECGSLFLLSSIVIGGFNVWLGDSDYLIAHPFDHPTLLGGVTLDVELNVDLEVSTRRMRETNGDYPLESAVRAEHAVDLTASHAYLDSLEIGQAFLNPLQFICGHFWVGIGMEKRNAENSDADNDETLGEDGSHCGKQVNHGQAFCDCQWFSSQNGPDNLVNRSSDHTRSEPGSHDPSDGRWPR